MDLRTLDARFADCEILISNVINKSLDSESYKHEICRSLVLETISNYETIIEDIFVERANKTNDRHIINYVKNQVSKKFRSPDLSKITEILSQFDPDLKKEFLTKVANSPIHSAWDNLMKARHSIVHKQGNLQLTYDELKRTYPDTKTVLEELISLLT
ncbi:HEPN domain-containing protein [Leptospira idonii]|uniref:RiboL-PSP-HEPN domain-containing protein n=1 Tax=Leptospira idonii TaxID=1193500 RepID=A0A4R9M260_9LEPT|nr:HEPN domain-containing protein [Leptospira idonii]TGN18848.1 hypothetical protein EHS15_11785 [Leptospira idonii]